MFLLLEEYICDYIRVYQIKGPCILPSPENKLPDSCQSGGRAACPSTWHGRGDIGTQPLFPHPSTGLLVSAFSSCPTFRRVSSILGLFFFFLIFIYLFLAVLGLRFCARASSSCGKRGPLFIGVHGPLTIAASLVVEHRLQTRRLSSYGS